MRTERKIENNAGLRKAGQALSYILRADPGRPAEHLAAEAPGLTVNEENTVVKFVAAIRKALGKNLLLAELFGSKARGNFSADSDIDVLLVVREKTPEIRDRIFTALFEIDPYYEYKISPVIYSEFEYKKNAEMESPFLENLNAEGIAL